MARSARAPRAARANTHTHAQVVSCLRRLELLALEEKNEQRLQQQRQRAIRQAAEAEAAGSSTSRQNGGGGSRYAAGLGGERDAAAKVKAVGEGGGVSQRQLGLVEMKLQVRGVKSLRSRLGRPRVAASSAGFGRLQVQRPLPIPVDTMCF